MEENKVKKKSPIARVWELGESGHKELKISIFLAILGVLAGVIPYVSASSVVVMLIEGERDLNKYLMFVGAGAAGYILNTLLYTGALGISHKATFRILKEIREKVMHKLPKLPLGTIIDMKSGKLKQIIVDQIESMETTLAHVYPEIISNFGGFLVVWILMFIVDWRMALIAMIPLPIGIMFMSASMRGYGEKYAESVEITTQMNESLIEYTGGIEVIKAYNQGDKSYATLAERCKTNASFFYNWMNSCKTNIYAMIIAPCTMLTVLPFGWLFYQKGTLEFGDFVTSIILSICLVGPLMAIMDFVDTLAKLGTVVENVDLIINAEEQSHSKTGNEVTSGNSVKLRNVTFSYSGEGEDILKGVSLDIAEGTKTALVGPSGSGKSTIAKLIAGFWDIDSGEISFGGVDTRDIPLSQLYDKIAYVAQENFLFDDTIMENIRMGNLSASDEEVIECAKASGCHDFIEKLSEGYNTRVGGGGAHLSGGERQRIAIARAMLKDAPIVILDEATAYIDPENEAIIQNAISRLVQGKTLIVIAHRLSTITDSDQIALINDGKVEMTGTQSELLERSDLYRKMWEAYLGAKDGDEQ
ncbi:MAG: ABC transporter ATP-binding protein/permease [Eubacterium sp.]|nr:ABC transporter ATP-binding protein/permease [Eubacterium sp.]